MEVQKERQTDFKMYVNNQVRQQAFKMAVLGYNTLKDDDPAEAAKYKAAMSNIISHNTEANVLELMATTLRDAIIIN